MENSQRGISLVITFLIMAIMLAIVLGISSILSGQIKIMSNAGNAISAFYAAESGIERTLYLDRKQTPIGSVRGLCNICNACNGTNCLECTATSISKDGSNGCDLQSCTNCNINYHGSFDGRTYFVDARIQNGIFSIDSRGFYKEASRQITY